MNKKGQEGILLFFFIIMVIAFAFAVNEITFTINNYCESNDMERTDQEIDFPKVHVECNGVQYFDVYCSKEYRCIEKDKWRECIKEEEYIICEEGR